jgi:hypothetical protein
MEPVSSVRVVTEIRAVNPGNRTLAPNGDFSLRQELETKEPGKEKDHVKDGGTKSKRI